MSVPMQSSSLSRFQYHGSIGGTTSAIIGFLYGVVKHQVSFAVFDYRWVSPYSIDVLGPRD
jgi:hypothetical protein